MKIFPNRKTATEPSLMAYIIVIAGVGFLILASLKALDIQNHYYIKKYVKKECLK